MAMPAPRMRAAEITPQTSGDIRMSTLSISPALALLFLIEADQLLGFAVDWTVDAIIYSTRSSRPAA